MQNVVGFYEKLPRGAAPQQQARGPLQWYRMRYMGKNPSPMRMSTYSKDKGTIMHELRLEG